MCSPPLWGGWILYVPEQPSTLAFAYSLGNYFCETRAAVNNVLTPKDSFSRKKFQARWVLISNNRQVTFTPVRHGTQLGRPAL
jgi:hypothetical protein